MPAESPELSPERKSSSPNGLQAYLATNPGAEGRMRADRLLAGMGPERWVPMGGATETQRRYQRAQLALALLNRRP